LARALFAGAVHADAVHQIAQAILLNRAPVDRQHRGDRRTRKSDFAAGVIEIVDRL
jgi:hypothetical protein